MQLMIPKRGALVLDTDSLGTAQVLLFSWVVRTEDGRQVAGNQEVTAGTALSDSTRSVVPMVEGQLLYASIRALNAVVAPGLVWARMSVTDQPTLAGAYFIPVVQGWAGGLEGPTYPTHPIWPPDGLGSPPVWLPVPDPAPGVAATLTLTALEAVSVQGVKLLLTTDATVINRTPRISWAIGVGEFVDWVAANVLAASVAGRVTFLSSCGAAAAIANIMTQPGGEVALPRGSVIAATALNLQAADQIADMQVLLRWRPVSF